MTVPAEAAVTHSVQQSVLVSAPAMKFAIGLVAALSAVFFPRLIAALTAADHPHVTVVSREYCVLALSFSTLVAAAVMILEWRVPREPRDTFMTTLGVPAMLAGALSASQGTTALQQAAENQERLGRELGKVGGISIESRTRSGEPDKQGIPKAFVNAMVTPVYAEGQQSVQPPPRLGIYVEEPRYLVVLDRAAKLEDAQARMADLTTRINRTTPQRPVALQIERHGSSGFLVLLSGGPRPRTAALLAALHLKDAYHVAPTLVEVPPTK